MYSSLYQAQQALRREIYGHAGYINGNKVEQLVNNLKLYSPELVISDNWDSQIKPLAERLCSFDHVKIIAYPNFLTFEKVTEGGITKIHSSPHHAKPEIVASFSGFVDVVEKDVQVKGIPKYYFIYTLNEYSGNKAVRFSTRITANILLDGKDLKTT